MFQKRKEAKALAAREAATEEGLRTYALSLIADDGTLPESADHQLAVYMREHDITDGLPQDVSNTLRIAMAASGTFAKSPTTLLLKQGEWALEETPGELGLAAIEQEATDIITMVMEIPPQGDVATES